MAVLEEVGLSTLEGAPQIMVFTKMMPESPPTLVGDGDYRFKHIHVYPNM